MEVEGYISLRGKQRVIKLVEIPCLSGDVKFNRTVLFFVHVK
jgi:hypothetical protein